MSWREKAACRNLPTSFFYDYASERGKDGRLIDRPALKAAKAVCEACPSELQCLEYAMSTNEKFGLWGKLDASERQKLRRELLKKASNLEAHG